MSFDFSIFSPMGKLAEISKLWTQIFPAWGNGLCVAWNLGIFCSDGWSVSAVGTVHQTQPLLTQNFELQKKQWTCKGRHTYSNFLWPFWDGDLWPFQRLLVTSNQQLRGQFESPGVFSILVGTEFWIHAVVDLEHPNLKQLRHVNS